MSIRTLMIVAFSLISTPASSGLVFEQKEIAPGVIVFVSQEPGIGNTVALITDRDVLAIDSRISPLESRAMLNAIRERTDKPVRYLINTHWHDDHIWGNQSFTAECPGIEILSHYHTREAILTRAAPGLEDQIKRIGEKIVEREAIIERGTDEQGTPLTTEQRTQMIQRIETFRAFHRESQTIQPTPPTLVFEKELVLHRGKEIIRIAHLGKGHTEGDVVVYLPDRKVLIAGDLVTYPFPAAAEAFLSDWIDVLGQLEELSYDVLVPGHGPVISDQKYVRNLRELLTSVVTQVEKALAGGQSLEDTLALVNVNHIRTRFVAAGTVEDRAFDRFFLRPAIESAYRELSAAPQ